MKTEEQPEIKQPKPKLTDQEKIGTLVSAVLLVVKGLRGGSIKSKGILLMDPKATCCEAVSLESELWKSLHACGLYEKINEETK